MQDLQSLLPNNHSIHVLCGECYEQVSIRASNGVVRNYEVTNITISNGKRSYFNKGNEKNHYLAKMVMEMLRE